MARHNLLILLERLPKLTDLTVDYLMIFEQNINTLIQNNVPELNKNFSYNIKNNKFHLRINRQYIFFYYVYLILFIRIYQS